MRFTFFHLMPFTEYPEQYETWPVSNRTFDPEAGNRMYTAYTETMAYAEQCGFEWIGCNEHHFSPYSLMANCNLIGANLVSRTKTVKLAMLGNLVPLLNPVRVAEEYAMLDVMSGGRLVAGFMRGIPHEYVAYNIPPNESRARLQEAVDLIKKAWTEPDPFGWEGEFYEFPSVSIWPRPFQQPHPPFLISGSNEDSAEFAARNGAMMGMVLIADLGIARRILDIYRDVRRAHGAEPGPGDILIGQHTCIAETDDEAKELMKGGLHYFHQVLMKSQVDAQRMVIRQTRFFASEQVSAGHTARLKTLEGRTLDDMIEAGSVLCGSPETVVRQIKRLHQELGTGQIQMTMKVGNIPDAAVKRGMELFRDRVLPEVRDL